MMQGDGCMLAFAVKNNALTPVTPEDIQDMEITLGTMRKTLGTGGLYFQDGLWLFPLSQAETFSCWPAHMKCQIRILWNNGVVEGKSVPGVKITESISKEVL